MNAAADDGPSDDADVLVIGGGNAALCAALSARGRGVGAVAGVGAKRLARR